MTKELVYTSSIKDMPLMFSEMKRTALLLCDGKSAEEILQLSLEQNVYQLEKEKRRRDVPLRMIKRLSTISKPLTEILAHGSSDEARLVAFLALMKADRFIFEYMAEVYADRFIAGYDEITDRDFMEFIDRKVTNSTVVEKWTTQTLARLGTTIKSIICDAGLAKRTKNGLQILKPLVGEAICRLLSHEERIYAKAMLLA